MSLIKWTDTKNKNIVLAVVMKLKQPLTRDLKMRYNGN